MFYPIEESLKEHIILLLISEFILIESLKGLHQLAEAILREVSPIEREGLHDLKQWVVKPDLSFFIVLSLAGTFKQIDNELGSSFDRDVIVCLEVEEKCPEDLQSTMMNSLQWLLVIDN